MLVFFVTALASIVASFFILCLKISEGTTGLFLALISDSYCECFRNEIALRMPGKIHSFTQLCSDVPLLPLFIVAIFVFVIVVVCLVKVICISMFNLRKGYKSYNSDLIFVDNHKSTSDDKADTKACLILHRFRLIIRWIIYLLSLGVAFFPLVTPLTSCYFIGPNFTYVFSSLLSISVIVLSSLKFFYSFRKKEEDKGLLVICLTSVFVPFSYFYVSNFLILPRDEIIVCVFFFIVLCLFEFCWYWFWFCWLGSDYRLVSKSHISSVDINVDRNSKGKPRLKFLLTPKQWLLLMLFVDALLLLLAFIVMWMIIGVFACSAAVFDINSNSDYFYNAYCSCDVDCNFNCRIQKGS